MYVPASVMQRYVTINVDRCYYYQYYQTMLNILLYLYVQAVSMCAHCIEFASTCLIIYISVYVIMNSHTWANFSVLTWQCGRVQGQVALVQLMAKG